MTGSGRAEGTGSLPIAGLPFSGLGVALATPFTEEHAVDEQALVRLVQHVVRGGADFVVALGSTGEAAMLIDDERDLVVETVREHRGRAKLVVGTGAPSSLQTMEWTRWAAQLGADAALVVMPPYTKPTQDGIVAHFELLHEAAPDLPLIAYNVPSRTGVNLLPATVRRLFELPNVVALKESSGDLLQITRIAAELPPGRTLLAGDDALVVPTIAAGGRGVVSVAGNVVPDLMRRLVDAALHGDLTLTTSLQKVLLPLFDALSAEPNPIPVKTALALCGIGGPDLRLPLLPASPATRDALQRALHTLKEPTHA